MRLNPNLVVYHTHKRYGSIVLYNCTETLNLTSGNPLSILPSDIPSILPSDIPSTVPSMSPSDDVSRSLPQWEELALETRAPAANTLTSDFPSAVPSDLPSGLPSDMPSDMPSLLPSDIPSLLPSDIPSMLPSDFPSITPPIWGDKSLNEDDVEFVCSTNGNTADAPTRDVLYAYKLELTESGSSLEDAVAAIEKLLQVYLSTGPGSVCQADEADMGHVVGITAAPDDVPAAACDVLTERQGDGPCSYVAGRIRVAVQMDVAGDSAAEAGIYCRTLDLIRGFLDSGAIEQDLTEVARVRSAILGQLVPDFCSVDSPSDTIGAGGTLFEGQGSSGDESGSDRGIDVDEGSVPTDVAPLEQDVKKSAAAGRAAFVVPLTVVLSITMALLVSYFVYKKRRSGSNQQQNKDEIQRDLMDQRYASQDDPDVENSFASGHGSDDEAWPRTPDSMMMRSMSEVDGASELASPASNVSGVKPVKPGRFQGFNNDHNFD